MALNKTLLVPVTSISSGQVSYTLEELHVNRTFSPGETKQISVNEIRALAYTSGGLVLVKELLSVNNVELLNELGIHPEAEYFWTRADVEDLLVNGSLARLQDALDFAPQGIIELIQQVAVETELNDMSKREAIKTSTGYDVTKVIELFRPEEDEEVVADKEAPSRRVSAEGPVRRVAPEAKN